MFSPVPSSRFRELSYAASSGTLSESDISTYGPVESWDLSQIQEIGREPSRFLTSNSRSWWNRVDADHMFSMLSAVMDHRQPARAWRTATLGVEVFDTVEDLKTAIRETSKEMLEYLHGSFEDQLTQVLNGMYYDTLN